MKKVLFLGLAVISIIAIKCRQDPQNNSCRDVQLIEMMQDSICPLTCQGVCACNGVTYCNECDAMKEGFSVHPADTIPCSQK